MDLSNINVELKAKVKGGIKPKGTIKVSGAKNSATKLLAAAMISDEKVILNNFPTELVDVQYKIDFIRNCGGVVNISPLEDKLEIETKYLSSLGLDSYDFLFRTTYLLVPGLIKKEGVARIPYPGGCKIGSRGYDLHIMVWEAMGAEVKEYENYIEIKAPNGFKASDIEFPISTIGGTETALICSAIINEGETKIRNAYISPEVTNLIEFLRSMGADISVIGNSYIKVKGSNYLKGSIFSVIPDRIEAITWMCYSAISGGDIIIKDVPFDYMDIPLIHVREAGIDYFRNSNDAYINKSTFTEGIQPFELACGTHPGIISDMQPFYVLLGLHAKGKSRVYDYRYPERISYLNELSKFYPGALEYSNGKIIINGGGVNQRASVKSTDLRGSMALLLAALVVEGESEIYNFEMALRGYNGLINKLSNVGCQVEVLEQS